VFSDVPARYEAMSLRQAYDHVLERRTIADPRKDRVLEEDVCKITSPCYACLWKVSALHQDVPFAINLFKPVGCSKIKSWGLSLEYV
jgi:hypothetical protein